MEANETPRAALVREIAEELTLMLEQRDLCPASFAEEAGAPPIVLLLYEARRWSGPIIAREGQQWGWFAMADAARLDLAPMDAVLLAQLAA